MGDAGEGLIDADAKIQERMEELQLSRAQSRRPAVRNPEQVRAIESLKLAHKEMGRQLENTTHAARRAQIANALAEIDRRIAAGTGRARRVGLPPMRPGRCPGAPLATGLPPFRATLSIAAGRPTAWARRSEAP